MSLFPSSPSSFFVLGFDVEDVSGATQTMYSACQPNVLDFRLHSPRPCRRRRCPRCVPFGPIAILLAVVRWVFIPPYRYRFRSHLRINSSMASRRVGHRRHRSAPPPPSSLPQLDPSRCDHNGHHMQPLELLMASLGPPPPWSREPWASSRPGPASPPPLLAFGTAAPCACTRSVRELVLQLPPHTST